MRESKTKIWIAVMIIVALCLVGGAMVYSVFHARPVTRAPARVYVVDDIKSATDRGRARWFVECEDQAAPDVDAREKHVWITESQRKILHKGDPCPLGEGAKRLPSQ